MSLRPPPSFISFKSCSRRPVRSFAILSGSASRLKPCFHPGRHKALARLTGSSNERTFHASAPSAAPKDPYQVLGVKKDATPAEIKNVYFSLARKYHPDTNPDKNARDKFVEIQEAYDILKDEKKRKTYDQYGAASQQPGFDPEAWANAAKNPFGSGAHGFEFRDFSFGGSGAGSDLFEQLFGNFGGGGGKSGFSHPARGEDLQATIGVSFMEACKGTTRTINVTPVEDCSACTGSGLKPGAKRSPCRACGGTGTRTFIINNGFQMASTCTSCEGTGTTVPRSGQCGVCKGVGKVRTRKTVKVEVPAGVEDGMTIRIPNAGDAAVDGSGPAGDLLVKVNVASSKIFRRNGVNIYYEARIPLHTALLGGRVRVPTLDGEVDVRVPSGTQQAEEMVLKDQGVTRLMSSGSSRGDLFVTFSVQLPRSLTQRQREILQQYADDAEGRKPANVKPGSTPDPSKPTEPDSTSESRMPNEVEGSDNNNDPRHNQEEEEGTEDIERRKRKSATA